MAEYRIHDRMYKVPDYETYERLIYEPGRVARIKLNRPRYRNALSHPLLSEMEHAFGRATVDPECRVIVLSGEGVCFSAGDDAFGLTPESAPMMADGRTPEQLMQDYGSEGELWRQVPGGALLPAPRAARKAAGDPKANHRHGARVVHL